MKKSSLHIWLFAGLVVALYLPFFISSLFITLFVLHALLTADYRKPGKGFFKKYALPLSFTLYVLLALVSMLYSDNQVKGWGAIESMLGFLVIPWAVIAHPRADQQKMWRLSSKWFLIATLLVAAYFFMAFTVINGSINIANYLLPARFEKALELEPISLRLLSLDFMHPGYFSIYVGLALMIAVAHGVRQKVMGRKWLLYLSVLPLFLFLFLLQSRMVIISLFVVAFIFLVSLQRYWKLTVPLMLSMVGIAALLIFMAPSEIAGRFSDFQTLEYEKTDKDFNGITVRLAMWDDVFEVIKENPVLGVGIGDFRLEAIEAYDDSGLQYAVNKKLDPHNQYLSTWLALGLPGFISLLLIFYFLIVPAFRNGQKLAFLAPIFIALCAISESVLIRHWGIVILSSLVFLQSYLAMRQKEEQAVEKSEE